MKGINVFCLLQMESKLKWHMPKLLTGKRITMTIFMIRHITLQSLVIGKSDYNFRIFSCRRSRADLVVSISVVVVGLEPLPLLLE